MKVVENEQILFSDVDDTLIRWDEINPKDGSGITILDPYDDNVVRLRPHLPHIKLIKDRKARGATIVVWSGGGYKWAEAVVRALELEDYVDYILSKPTVILDDLPLNEAIGHRVYLQPDHNYGAVEVDNKDTV